MKHLIKLYARCAAAVCYLQSPFLLFVRLYWGWQLVESGWGKLHHLDKITAFFTELNIPFPALNAHFVSGLEFFGGILLILGLASRLTGFMLTINMFVAFWTADREALRTAFTDDPSKFYAADPFTFLCAAFIILIYGAGLFSIDAYLKKRYNAQLVEAGVEEV